MKINGGGTKDISRMSSRRDHQLFFERSSTKLGKIKEKLRKNGFFEGSVQPKM